MPRTSEEEMRLRLSQVDGKAFRIASAGAYASNRWRYALVEARPQKEGRYQEVPGIAATRYLAFNTIETNNDGAGIEGSGDDVTDQPRGIRMISLGAGGVIGRLAIRGNNEAHFAHPNNLGGRCDNAVVV